MVENGKDKEKISELDAYVKVLQEDMKSLDEYKSYVTTLRSEMGYLKKEVENLWIIAERLRESGATTESDIKGLNERVERAFTKLKNHSAEIAKINKDYPEIREVFRSIKKKFIAVIATAIVLSIFIGAGLYLYLSVR